MAGKKGHFSVNTNRIDPYKNYKFRMMVASALAAIAGLGLMKKLSGASTSKRKSTYQTPKPIEEGSRPIEAVGTSTAGRARKAPQKARRSRSATARKGAKTKRSGAPKRR
jgi:hypothetical protein